MDLKSFVRESLTQIVQGVAAAQKEAHKLGAVIDPPDGYNRRRESVEFDVAVTVTEGSGSAARIGVLAGIVGGKIEGSSQKQGSAAHHIKFAVSLFYPESPTDNGQESAGS